MDDYYVNINPNQQLGNIRNLGNITPETYFYYDLNNAWNFLENFLSRSNFELIKSNIDKFNFKIFKNPALILLAFIVYKNSGKTINPKILKKIFYDPRVSPLIKENNISLFDLIRYSRFIELYIPIEFIDD